jgi:hypothetical protein
LHGGATVDEASDRHPVIKVVRLASDEMNRACRVLATHVVGCGNTGNSVADNDNMLN